MIRAPQISQISQILEMSPKIYQHMFNIFIFSTFSNEKSDKSEDFRSHAPDVDIDSYDCAALREALRVVSPKMLSAARLVETGDVL